MILETLVGVWVCVCGGGGERVWLCGDSDGRIFDAHTHTRQHRPKKLGLRST